MPGAHSACSSLLAQSLQLASSSSPRVLGTCGSSAPSQSARFGGSFAVAASVWRFAAPSLRLVVEVDGRRHEQQVTADARRDRDLSRLGYHVVRIPAEFVMEEL